MSRSNGTPAWRRNAFPGKLCFCCCNKKAIKPTEHVNHTSVKQYLENHPSVAYEVIQSFSPPTVERRKSSVVSDRSHAKFSQHDTFTSKSALSSISIQSELYLKESKEQDLSKLLFNAAGILASILEVDWYWLYLPCHHNTELMQYASGGHSKHYGPIGTGMTVSAEAAFRCTTLMVENLPQDARFPNGIGHPENNVQSVLSFPVVLVSGDFLGVIELCKDGMKDPFDGHDLQVSNSYLGWMVTSLHQAKMTRLLHLQSAINDGLLDSTKNIFDDMISIDNLVEKILLFTKDLVNADRCAMFLVDEESEQLYAHYFDEGSVKDGKRVFTKESHIRFSFDKGIAGHVYQTGEVVNIADAYVDSRFNPEVDRKTGYHTKNILCMPIISKSHVVGVLQMINSLWHDQFTPGDEEAFKTYAVYCALAVHCSRLYNLLERSKAQYNVAMEVLSYHMISPEKESQILVQNTPLNPIPDSFPLYDFNAYEHEEQLPQLFIFMIHKLCGKNAFNLTKMSRFILTVRKNYRPVPYHNWFHAIHVAHSLYCMLKVNMDKFGIHDAMSLVVAGVCHDLDHRGFNNCYLREFNKPETILYSRSFMEEQHYEQMVIILHLEGHDMFSNLAPKEYKNMLLMIHDAIVATDLDTYIGNQQILKSVVTKKSFNTNTKEWKKVCKELMMMAADQSAMAKPWSTQESTVASIYAEYYMQGDEEKRHGIKPGRMLDRDYQHEIAKQEVTFIKSICTPLFTALDHVLPGVAPLLQGSMKNLKQWEKVAKRGQGD